MSTQDLELVSKLDSLSADIRNLYDDVAAMKKELGDLNVIQKTALQEKVSSLREEVRDMKMRVQLDEASCVNHTLGLLLINLFVIVAMALHVIYMQLDWLQISGLMALCLFWCILVLVPLGRFSSRRKVGK